MPPDLLFPDWPAHPRVRAVMTTRRGGVSPGVYASLNLGDHVGDDIRNVQRNRQLLTAAAGLPAEPVWLKQVHGYDVVDAREAGCEADASFTDRNGVVCAVLTADCLPLLLSDRSGRAVSAVHAGWRGLAAGVIERAVSRFEAPADSLLAWMGPAIGPMAFEVGDEVRQAFIDCEAGDARAFQAAKPGHWWADLYQLTRLRLTRAGVGFIGGGDYCTVTDRERFFSYRRDGVTGRMASLIWLEEPGAGES
ncbi:MAG: peptidoglycan editing factor PgeF [Candidatus Thiodiazotropha sp.]